MRTAATVTFTSLLVLGLQGPATGQPTLERGPVQPETWTGIPWSLELAVVPLFAGARDGEGSGLVVDPGIRAALALPAALVAELRYSPQPIETDGADEVEAALRVAPLRQDHGDRLDLALEGRVATGTEAATATLTGARWIGPLRLAANTRTLLARGESPRLAAGAGALWHPAPGRLPIALAGDVVGLTGSGEGRRLGWSAAVQLGVSFTAHTLSLFATNTGNSLPARMAGTDRTRVGLELTTHVPLGRFFGLHAPREVARQAVRPPDEAGPAVVIPIREYRYAPDRIEIQAGTAVEWVNHDHAVHTASADDGAWNSGAILQGQSWRAVFHEPGVYTYHCGPHPFMRGVVVVR